MEIRTFSTLKRETVYSRWRDTNVEPAVETDHCLKAIVRRVVRVLEQQSSRVVSILMNR